jgi:hypothetical protein
VNWGALFSLRVWFGAVFVGLLAAILPALLWPPLGTVAFVLAFGWVMYFQVTQGTPLRCPFCRKRVKIGATACHHCGRAVA